LEVIAQGYQVCALFAATFCFFEHNLLQYTKILYGVIPMNSYFYYRIDRLFSKKQHLKPKNDTKKTDEINEDEEDPELFVERIRLEKIELRLLTVYSKIC
jgi:hypothetical protein